MRLLVLLALSNLIVIAAGQKYTDENRPYKFGFNIEGHQHRKEEKGEDGTIKGEYGFITADGYYRVTVYETDTQGRFKIVSQKNYYVGFPPGDPTTTPAFPNKAKSASKVPATTTQRNIVQTRVPVAPVKTTKHGREGASCGSCLLPTTTQKIVTHKTTEKVMTERPTETTPIILLKNLISQGRISGYSSSPQLPKKNTLSNRINLEKPTSPLSKTNFTTLQNDDQPEVVDLWEREGIIHLDPPVTEPPLTTTQQVPDVSEPPLTPTPKVPQTSEVPSTKTTLDRVTSTVSPTPRTGIRTDNVNEVENVNARREGNPGDENDLLYHFNYTVGFHGHHEDGYRNGTKIGGYFVTGRDGVSRKVNYVANQFGYQPNITLTKLDENDVNVPKQETEKSHGLKGYEFKWFPRKN